MHLIERFWTAITYLSGILTLSPSYGVQRPQRPIPFPSDISQTISSHVSADFPIFVPPSGDPDEADPFLCEYPDMPDYEFCGNENSGCWLRHKTTKQEIGINTDYERIELTPQGQTRNVDLVLENSHWDADGQNFPFAKLFRNASDPKGGPQYPGPWIQACWGDTLNINVYNNLESYTYNGETIPGNGTTIHWHGVRMLNRMQMDGVNGVTQCPIAPGKSMTYNFRVMQYGSSWYHSHYSVQYADGALGPMTFHGPSSGPYDEAIRPIIMTDWGHNSAFYAVLPGNILANKTILLNGLGDVTKFGYDNTTTIKPPYEITFVPKRRYLMRLINASFGTHFIFSIDGHTMNVIEADYVPIKPYGPREFVHVAIGQRLHVIVTALDSAPSGDGNFWIRTFVGQDCVGIPFGTGKGDNTAAGIVRYKGNKATPTSSPWSPIPTTCEDEPYYLQTPIHQWFPGSAANGDFVGGETFQVAFPPATYPVAAYALQKIGPGSPLTPTAMHINYSDPMQLNLDKNMGNADAWDPDLVVIPETFSESSWVYLVLNSTDSPHPIHLHGHDFAIVAAGSGDYDPTTVKLNQTNPARRDVVVLPIVGTGYAVIAFKTDNPGSWLVHCHIAFHAAQGLGVQILERQSDANNIWPPGSPVWNAAKQVCDDWIAWNTTAKAEDLDSGI